MAEPEEPPFALLRGLGAMVYAASPILPVAAPVLFGGGWYRGNEIDATHISSALPWSGVAFWFAAAFWLHQIVQWWGHRYRSGIGIVLAVVNIALAGLTLTMANAAGLDRYHGTATLHLAPIWATIVLAAVVIVVYAISPPEPAARIDTGA